jgi:hypothetical protein
MAIFNSYVSLPEGKCEDAVAAISPYFAMRLMLQGITSKAFWKKSGNSKHIQKDKYVASHSQIAM